MRHRQTTHGGYSLDTPIRRGDPGLLVDAGERPVNLVHVRVEVLGPRLAVHDVLAGAVVDDLGETDVADFLREVARVLEVEVNRRQRANCHKLPCN